MALKDPRTLYGIHSFTAINRTTGIPFGTPDNGILKVVGSANFGYDTELNPLRGGSNPHAVNVERGITTAEITLTTKEYPTWLRELAGATVVANSAETSGTAESLANSIGTSAFDASTGIASVAVSTADDVKDGFYFVKAVSTTTVDVYVDTDIAFRNGADAAYVDESLKVTATPLTVAGTGATVAIPNFGIELTGGSGTVAFVTGDVATFTVRSANVGSTITTFGEAPEPLEFEAICYGQKKATGDIFGFRAPRCILASSPINFAENEFSTSDLTIMVLFDCSKAKLVDFFDTDKAAECS